MTFLETWIRTPFSQAIAWTLFHVLWQGFIAAAILAPALCVVRPGRNRYTAACLAMLGVVLSFGLTFAYHAPWAEVFGAGVVPIDVDSLPDAVLRKNPVPIQNLFDYLESGASLEEFLIGFPPITRDQAIKVLELARTGLFDSLSRSENLTRP